jgi:site-specific DNA-methyltransferase (adenine-specific)
MLGYNTVYCSNCLDIFPQIDDSSIDCIITDPPYNIGYVDWDKFYNIEQVTCEWYRILKPTGSVFCFSGWGFVTELITRFNQEFTLKDWIIYDRIKGRGGTKSLVSTREDILWYIKSDTYTFNKNLAYSTIVKKTKGMGSKNGKDTRALSNVWTDISPIVPWSKERVAHPTQKPLQLIKRIIDVFTNPDDLILDCYLGSGTTAVACKETGRRYIGIEQNPEYVKLAKERLGA